MSMLAISGGKEPREGRVPCGPVLGFCSLFLISVSWLLLKVPSEVTLMSSCRILYWSISDSLRIDQYYEQENDCYINAVNK